MNRKIPLSPKDGSALQALLVARISGCVSQKDVSLDDQVDHCVEVVTDLYDGPVAYEHVSTKGKGERLDRPELQQIEDSLRSGKFDVMVMEDIGRLVRGGEAKTLWGIAVDHGTRCIAANDGLDTADPNWEKDVLEACAEHLGHNEHVSKRLQHKLGNRFRKGQGAVPLPIAGYVKPEGGNTYDAWSRVEEATPIIEQGLALLRKTMNCSAVADFFNNAHFQTGPYMRSPKWDGVDVRRYFQNPLLGGRPARGFKVSVKHYETGVRKSVKNTDTEPVYLDYPHLAHVSFEELQEVNALLDDHNANYRRRRRDGADPRSRIPKSRTLFPGQHVTCHYCGRTYLWGGNGITENLMCAGPRDWVCWNSISFNGALLTQRVMSLITSQLYKLDGFDKAMIELAQASQDASLTKSRAIEIEKQLKLVAVQESRLTDAIAELGLTASLKAKHKDLIVERAGLSQELRSLKLSGDQALTLPRTSDELRHALEEEFGRLGCESYEFGDLLRQLVPEIHVHLVQLVTGGMPVPRARIKLDLIGNLAGEALPGRVQESLASWHVSDLFEPPVFVKYREEITAMHAAGRSLKVIARSFAEPMSTNIVQKALGLQRTISENGLDGPYVTVTEAPSDVGKMRRHKNPRYKFELLGGYEPPDLF